MKAEDLPGASSTPAFGAADLSNCEREPIHLAGAIQPHGALLVLDAQTLGVVQASTNAAGFLDLGRDPIGEHVAALPGDVADRIAPYLDRVPASIPVAVSCRAGIRRGAFDCLVHRPHEQLVVLEFERAERSQPISGLLGEALERIAQAPSLPALSDTAGEIFKTLTGYDRVMIYRFDEAGHGEVFAESREPELEPLLGNRYPASDIPQIARRLYERNRVRLLSDVHSEQVPLVPVINPVTGADLDMSLCTLRSMSPIHVQYLRNMGVSGTLVASLMVGGRLWGLVSCHHYSPRCVDYDLRTQCELLAEAVSTRVTALESFAQARAELAVRRIEQHMRAATRQHGDWRAALFDSAEPLLWPLGAAGAALLFEGQVHTVGEVPATEHLREIAAWLDNRPRSTIYATAALGSEEPRFAELAPILCGLLAAPVSRTPGEYLMWMRPERVRTVVWGGNPHEAVIVGDDPADLSPRRSFAKWHELVRGTADAWSDTDETAANLIAGSVADVVSQFRSVRALIVRDQLDSLQAQVGDAEQPVLISDAAGRVLLLNEAMAQLLGPAADTPTHLLDIAAAFADRGAARACLDTLLTARQPWHAEVAFAAGTSETLPLLVRADPVISPRQKLLGFVVLLTDVSVQKNAERARARFQERIIDRDRLSRLRLTADADAQFRKLMAAIVDNAQLAALEITDGLNPARMPQMLDGVQSSVERSTELLEILLRHNARQAPR
ncbi:MAG: GAF domain-containing protein [Gammaproteobacteria bacterium]